MVEQLKNAPVIEVIWRLDFEEAVGDMLHGLLFFELQEEGYKSLKMPGAEIPEAAVLHDPNLSSMVRYRLEKQGSNVLFQLGIHFLTVNCQKPYIGWEGFKQEIDRIIELVQDKCRPKAHSLRYIDFLTLYDAPSIEGLELKVKLGEEEIKHNPLQIRIEQKEEDFNQVIHVVTPMSVPSFPEEGEGTVVDIETLQNLESFEDIDTKLAFLHSQAGDKFEKIISTETLEKFK